VSLWRFQSMPRTLRIEGYSPEEILALPDAEVDAFVFTGEPFLFRAGSAEVLGEFEIRSDRLVVTLAQIDGGGEGDLPTLWSLARRVARGRGVARVEWIVHAVTCAAPNPKLRRILTLRGFVVRDVPGSGEAYWFLDELEPPSPAA
jgi:hypothetical protein